MKTLPARQVKIRDGFWGPRLEMNAEIAIFHQWEQLEKTGCIENFRLVADKKEGFRRGYFFADSDAFKWLDAAARVYASYPSEKLKSLVDDFIDLIERTQTADGYIYTYNQFHFPEARWQNLQIEHELYCHGHLIEAGVSHFEATGKRTLLDIVIKSADLLVRDFSAAGPQGTPGHQEIEIALIRLYRATQNHKYLDLAEHFIEQRGQTKPFIAHILNNHQSYTQRSEVVNEKYTEYLAAHPEHPETFQMPGDNVSPNPPWGKQRWFLNMASGKYFQQHKPVRKQTKPVGHSVRFTYLETAIAMLYQENGDNTLRQTLEKAWDHMVSRRMYVTGGIGSLPNIEGFGRDFELNPKFSYSETCAALGNIFWNWELTLSTAEAKYADLTEWQLYNAAAVGLAQEGTSYLYNNPLACEGDVTRQKWFKCPCCPSNVSRTWADLGKYVYSFGAEGVWVHQYIGNQVMNDNGLRIKEPALSKVEGIGVKMESGLPWDGKVKIFLDPKESREFTVNLRVPSWSDGLRLEVNGETMAGGRARVDGIPHLQFTTASGFDPRQSYYLPVRRAWSPGDVIELEFEMKIQIRSTHPKVKATRGQVAVTRGPLVYCLESNDNPNLDIFKVQLDPASLDVEFDTSLFDGITVLRCQTAEGRPVTAIPYFLWANRGKSQMTVYFHDHF